MRGQEDVLWWKMITPHEHAGAEEGRQLRKS
jgi:hypothetical protein